MGKSVKLENRGVSLVEVMVVVAILAVLGGVGVMGINAMSGKPAQKCSQQIIYSIEKHRTSTMGKNKAKYVLCVDDGKIVAKEYLTNEDDFPASMEPTTIYELGDKRTKVSYVLNSDVDNPKDIATNPLTLEFERSTGAFKKQVDDSYCNKIIVQRGGRTFNITLVPLTGKVYAE